MKIYRYIKLVLFIAFSVLIFVYAEHLLHNLKYLIGSLMMAFGLEDVIVNLILEKKHAIKEVKFLYGFLEVILGILMLALIDDFVAICIIWSMWSIMREMFEIHEITNQKIKGPIAIVSLIESIVVFVFSFMLIITPTEHHAHTHIYLLIAEFLVTGFSPVFDELIVTPLLTKFKNKNNQQDVDKSEE